MNLASNLLACALACASLTGPLSTRSFSAVPPQAAQQAAANPRVFGTVTTIDPAAMRATIQTDAGETVTVTFAADTRYLRVPPEAQTFESGTKIMLAEVGVGDRVYAGGRYEAETKSVAARLLVVMSKSDIERRRESERAEWKRRGLAGTVSAVDVQKQEITVQVRSREGAKSMTLGVGPDTVFRRYVPDTVKFSEARPSSLADLKAGDQLRALVKQGGEGVRPVCEEVVSGEFLTVGGTVTAVDASKGEIKINLLKTQKPLTINLKPETLLRRAGPEVLAALGSAGQRPAASPQPGTAAPAAPSPKGVDIQEMLDRLSPLAFDQVKPGQMIVVSSTKGADPNRVTAITVIAGLDTLLKRPAPPRGRTPPNPNTGLPSGALDFTIGLP
ncbi:MAG TPA: hypothetical protein VFZ44_19080 [Pyrinomonadaceae bacterium]